MRKINVPKKDQEKVVGYPEIEKLIDSEDFSEVNKAFEKAYGELDAIARKKSGYGKGKDAKNAMKSLELVMDLLRGLLALKYKLQAGAAAQNKNNNG